jgi:WD40 repeat protein
MTGTTIQLYQGKTGSIASVAWAPDGAHFAAAGQDNLVWVRDFATNEITYSNSAFYYNNACPCELYGRGLAWSPDSSLLAYGTPDGAVHIVNVTQKVIVLTYRGHRAAINDLCWSPDGLYLASASEDHTVQLWEATTGKTTLTYKGHNSGVTSARWSPDGALIVSASPLEHTAQVWLAL